MPLLPRTVSEFTEGSYWQTFFKNRGDPFEWYGDWAELGESLARCLKPRDAILQLGCGNSALAEQLHDAGFGHVCSVDSAPNAVKQQIARNRQRPSLRFEQMDATQLSYADESFNVVLDKGTLDALLPPDADAAALHTVEAMFAQAKRVLAPSGRYVVVTLAQQHILSVWLSAFSDGGFILRVQQVPTRVDDNAETFMMPVFVLVAIKLKSAISSAQMYNFVDSNGCSSRLDSAAAVERRVRDCQEFGWFFHRCRAGSLQGESEVTMTDGSGKERFVVAVVDDPSKRRIDTYSVLIVPRGRECEFLFATAKGRQMLRRQTNQNRLAVVRLCRGQTYESLESVKAELNHFVVDFAPLKFRARKNNKLVQYLTVADDVGDRHTLENGKSELSGEFVVEQVRLDDRLLRRLVFLSSQNLIQSEVAVSPQNELDLLQLSCSHHEAMLIALALIAAPVDSSLRLCVVGLGGGLFATLLHKRLPQAEVVGVELDAAIVGVAERWFDFAQSDRLKCVVADGVAYLGECAAKQQRFDVIFVDVAGPMDSAGLSCPLPSFLADACLRDARSLLSPGGCLAMNVVTRDDERAAEVMGSVQGHFEAVFSQSSDEEVNRVVFALSRPVDAAFLDETPRRFSRLAKTVFDIDDARRNFALHPLQTNSRNGL